MTDQLIGSLYLTFEDYERAVDWDWFKHLWINNAREYAYFELAQSVKYDLTFKTWDQAWQNRAINHPNYKQARIEFVNALMEWY